ncbi:MAG: 2-amino-4-hydroxy-6-hydroxymethyldihydropteridine diphosphokinase [Dethiobacteria bacterium]|nr:2-amino-4-hydroxy-6-hydroxymethyldihydropteridine diphosphokinase [Dethiobacteria bacterium]
MEYTISARKISAYISLGTNLGDRLDNLKQALELLQKETSVKIITVSAIYETAPVGGPVQGPFLNACAILETDLSPTKLLIKMLAIEDKLGRVRKEMWGPRVIDLDLLIYEEVRMKTPLLELPHPRLSERDFVLVPLAEIAPALVIPGQNKKVADLLAARPETEDVKLFLPAGWNFT